MFKNLFAHSIIAALTALAGTPFVFGTAYLLEKTGNQQRRHLTIPKDNGLGTTAS